MEAGEKRRTRTLLIAVGVVALTAAGAVWWNLPEAGYQRLRLVPSHTETNNTGRMIAVFVCTNPYPAKLSITGSVYSYGQNGNEWFTLPDGPFDVEPNDVFTMRAYAPSNDCLWRFVVIHTVPLKDMVRLRARWSNDLSRRGWDRLSGWVHSHNGHEAAIAPLLTNINGKIHIAREPE